MKKQYRVLIITLVVIFAFCISVCFIPINATRLIPIVEKQVTKDLGINIHIERLILRLGPSLKLKAPAMHIMYRDGQKFGQFTNIKFFIPWSALVKKDIIIKSLKADKFILKLKSDDQYLSSFIEKLNSKKFAEIPDLKLKSYSISYNDVKASKVYKLTGTTFDTAKLKTYQNLQVNAIGEFLINENKYLSYDLSLYPNLEIPEKKFDFNDIALFLNQMEELNFYADIIADLKLYRNINNDLQISGLVNVDNISVLDASKKSPKSFIYLTFLGDKIGVLSNIYASADKKIYIDGVINNSKKKSVDLKVKTDEILLQDLYKKLKLLVDFSKFKTITHIDGKLKADFTVKGDLNKLKSTGFLKVKEGIIKANGIDINNISADVDFSNNIINIVNAVGYVNNAPIMIKGSINKNIDIELLMNKVELKHLLPASYGVQNGIASLVANISGSLDNIVHKENIQVEKFKCVNNANIVSFNSLKIDTNKENTAYINNILINTSKTDLVKIPQLKLYIDRDSVNIPETNIFMANSKLRAKADITNYNTKEPTFNFNMNGFINSRDIKAVKSNYAIYPVKMSISGNNKVQNIAAQILMEKALILDEPSIINIVSKIENNNVKIEDISVSSFSGKMSNDFKLNLKGQKKLLISGIIENINEAPTFKNIRVYIPQQLNISYFNTIAQLKGDIFINGNIRKPEIVGQLAVQNLINQFLQLAVNNLTIDFRKSLASVSAPQFKLGDSVMSINSTLSTDISNGLQVKNANIRSKFLNTDTLFMYKDSPAFNIIPINIEQGNLYLEKVLANIYNSPLHLSSFTSDLSLKNNLLSLNNLTAEAYNGKFAGNITFNLKDENFSSVIQARGVSAAPIFDLISTKKDSVSGTMDFDTSIFGNLSFKQSLNGKIKFIVNNGRMGSLGKLEHLLYAQNVIADNMLRTSLSVVTKAITLKDTGLFKYLRGDIELKNGIADIKFLQSQGPLMTLFIKGAYNPDTDYAKLIVLGRLSDEIISGLGVFGDFSFNKLMIMLTGEDNKYNILPEDFENLPQLPTKYTKEFRSVINGILEKPSSVVLFNWVSYSEKSYRHKDIPMTNVKIPEFIDKLPD